jgi:type VI secretion system protein VasD
MKGSEGSGAGRRAFVGVVGLLSIGLLGAVAIAPIACFPPPLPPKPDPCNVQIVTLNIYADEVINPEDNELTRPVWVKLYQLTADSKILNARYDDLYFKEKETLGDQMLKVDEFYVFPNSVTEIKFERIPEASILAGVAFFRSPVGQSWKTFYEFPPMPNTPEACIAPPAPAASDPFALPLPSASAAPQPKTPPPQAFPRTEFFVRNRKIDNGSEFDPSMFPRATAFKRINLPKASAEKASQQAMSPPPPAPKK